MKIYVELYLHYNLKLDLELLAKSLAEKTNILAQNPTTPFLSKETFQIINESYNDKVTKEQIITLIEQKIPEIEDPIEIESLEVLIQNLMSGAPSLAITKGLLENLKSNPQCKWIAYLIREHYQL